MAIYSLTRKSVSKALDRPGFAADHARYVLRSAACSTLVATLPPMVEHSRSGIARWMAAAEAGDRRNARICDRIMAALPIELSDRPARVALLRDFYGLLTRAPDRARPSAAGCIATVPYFAGLHDLDGDEDNPHHHGVVRDRCLCCGARVLGLGELGSTEWIRETWETAVNRALAGAGYYERVDRRSYARRGLWDRSPGRHRGPARSA